MRWPLGAIRNAAHHRGVTINDLLLAAVTAGMRNLLLSRGLTVDGLAVRVSVPVAAPAGSRNAGGTLPIVLSLPVGEPEPDTILRRINVQSRQAKAGRDRSYAGPAHSPLVPLFLVRLGIRWLRRHGASRINLYVTNVPGPPGPLWLCGARLRTVCPIAPIAAGVPLAVAVLSYHDTLSLTVNTTPGPNVRPFAEGARDTIEELIGAGRMP